MRKGIVEAASRACFEIIILLSILAFFFIISGCGGGNGNETDTDGNKPPALDNWHQIVPPPQSTTLNSVTFANGLFVSCGFDGAVLTSPDAMTWTLGNGGGSSILRNLAFGNGTFVTVGGMRIFDSLTGTILTSPDGIDWTRVIPVQQTTGEGSITFTTGPYLWSVAFGNGTFIAGASMKSTDGLTWAAIPSNHESITQTFGNDMFVSGSSHGEIWTSPDGELWTLRYSTATQQRLTGSTYGNGIFIVVGQGGTILRSKDGLTWSSETSGTTINLNGATYGKNTFIAVGDSGTIITSPDGVTWTGKNSGTTKNLYGATFGNSVFVVVGQDGIIFLSEPVQ